jgi:nucleoside-diphosphate-sugar epimerase
VHPQTEEYWGRVNPIGPRSCYDEGKRCAETLFFDYRRQHRLSIKVARIFNTYGPRMHLQDGRVVSNFIVQALRNEPITLYGDGRQTRSFCYVDDLVEALLRMMDNAEGSPGPVNVGNPVECTILALVQANGGVAARQLARALAVTPPNVAVWLDRLESRGLIERERSAADGRLQHIRIKVDGGALVSRATNALLEAEQLMLAGLSAAERAMLVELLHKAAQARQRREGVA